MYFYKVWISDFIEHVRIPHSILRHFLDRGFSGWRAENWASIVLCPTNSTQTSAIYKFIGGLRAGSLNIALLFSRVLHAALGVP
jgi:hypothetical protein